jgi:hypothetical protein
MVLNSKDSRFTKQLTATLNKANNSPRLSNNFSGGSTMNGTSIQQSTMLDTTATVAGFSKFGGAQPIAEKEQASMLEVIIEQDDERFAAHRRPSSVTSFDITMDIRDGSMALNTPHALTSAQKLILAGAPQGPFEMRPNQFLNKVNGAAAANKYC